MNIFEILLYMLKIISAAVAANAILHIAISTTNPKYYLEKWYPIKSRDLVFPPKSAPEPLSITEKFGIFIIWLGMYIVLYHAAYVFAQLLPFSLASENMSNGEIRYFMQGVLGFAGSCFAITEFCKIESKVLNR